LPKIKHFGPPNFSALRPKYLAGDATTPKLSWITEEPGKIVGKTMDEPGKIVGNPEKSKP